MSKLSDHKACVRAYVDAFNRRDYDALRALFSPDALVYGVLGAGDMDLVISIWKEIHLAFDITLEVESMIAEGDEVAVRYTERGRFVAPFRGQEPTGKPFEVAAMEWFIMKDGRIHRRWGARDSGAQSRQMGVKFA